MIMIDVQDVWKRYPGGWALRGVSFQVERGRVQVLLGENGSGKSTLLRILAGLTRPSRGTVEVMGEAVNWETRKRVAYLAEVNPFYDWMKVMEQVEFLARFYPMWDMDKSRKLLSFMGLDGDKKVGALSRGQQGRLKVVCAFSWPSDLVLMDEPLSGIDPPSLESIVETVFGEFSFEEQTILISTHMFNELSKADKVRRYTQDVIFMKEGEIVLSGNADDLQEEHGKSLSEIFKMVAM